MPEIKRVGNFNSTLRHYPLIAWIEIGEKGITMVSCALFSTLVILTPDYNPINIQVGRTKSTVIKHTLIFIICNLS
jgi:hypothetical protein